MPGHYFGIEPEKWLVEAGIDNECGPDLVKIKQPVFSYDSNFTCTSFGKQFDFILAHSIFTHATQTQIKRCLSEASNCMKPDAIFAATFMRGEANYDGGKWVYPDCITYSLEHMSQMVQESGLRCHPLQWYHRNQTLILITRPECQVNLPNVLPDASAMETLQNNLAHYKSALARLEGHPYVKFGKALNRIIRRRK
jgi:hypothetical protein